LGDVARAGPVRNGGGAFPARGMGYVATQTAVSILEHGPDRMARTQPKTAAAMEDKYAGTSVQTVGTREAENAGHSRETVTACTGTDSARTGERATQVASLPTFRYGRRQAQRGVRLGEDKGDRVKGKHRMARS